MTVLVPGDTGPPLPLIPLWTASGHLASPPQFLWLSLESSSARDLEVSGICVLTVGGWAARRGQVEGVFLGTVTPVNHYLFDPEQVSNAVLVMLALQCRAPAGKTFLQAPFHARPSTFLCTCIKLLLLSRQW